MFYLQQIMCFNGFYFQKYILYFTTIVTVKLVQLRSA